MKTIVALVGLCLFSFHLDAQVSFTTASTPGVGAGPHGVTAADVNGDGKLDLISADFNGSTVTVLTNNGNGGVVAVSAFAVGDHPQFAAAADVNADGLLDLITANYNANTLTVLTNKGSGSFVTASTLAVGIIPQHVAAADLNGDGKLDLVSANADSASLSVLTNNGFGGFLLAASPSVGNGAAGLAITDVNSDGKLDVISANGGSSTLSVLTNNGVGGLVLSATLTAGSSPRSVVAADVNGDGRPDLISANISANTLSVLTNNGVGGFALASTLNVGSGPFMVVAADVNGDGAVDLASANYGGSATGNTLSVLTNNGSGGFTVVVTPTVGTGVDAVTAGDLNGDGRADLISANFLDNTLSILTNSTVFPASSIPIITSQPASVGSLAGATVSFSVGATATGTELARRLTYQWRLTGTNLPLATNNILSLANVTTNQAGSYSVVVSNYLGSVTSTPAILDVSFIQVKVNSQPAVGTVTFTGSAQVSFAGGYPGGYFYYTLDGTTPDFGSPLYSGPFTVTTSVVVQAMSLSADFSQTAYSSPVTIQIVPTYNLQTSIIGSGTLATNPPAGPYASNSVVTLTATPAVRWAFDHWAGDIAGSLNPTNVTMNGPRNVQAIFVQTSFPLTVSSPGGGSVMTNGQVISGTNFFPVGTTLMLSATPSNGWSFIRWTGGTNSTANPLSVTITQTNSIQAIFGTVVPTNALGGSIVLNFTNPVPFGTTLAVSAVADPGNYFAAWTGSIGGTNSPSKISVTNATPSLGALFTTLPSGKFSLSVIVVGNGFETNNPPRSFYNPGDSVTLKALATNAGALFLGWSKDASGTNNPLTVVLNTNMVIQANFGVAPMVSITPLAQTVLAGSNTIIGASAIGIPPLAYQWQNSLGAIAGATNFIFAIANTQPTNAGNYFVVVTNLSGSVTSAVATVTVIGAPVITNQPAAMTTLTVGHAASFNVGAYGWPALTYRWQLNGAAVSGATSSSYTLANAFPANAGNYTVVITNIYGSVTSTPAALTVSPLNVTTPRISAPGQFQFTFDTATGVNYTVQYSTNLTQWLPLFTVGGVGVPLTLTDPTTGIPYRFYRIMVGP